MLTGDKRVEKYGLFILLMFLAPALAVSGQAPPSVPYSCLIFDTDSMTIYDSAVFMAKEADSSPLSKAFAQFVATKYNFADRSSPHICSPNTNLTMTQVEERRTFEVVPVLRTVFVFS